MDQTAFIFRVKQPKKNSHAEKKLGYIVIPDLGSGWPAMGESHYGW
jgi:hypothetical protein